MPYEPIIRWIALGLLALGLLWLLTAAVGLNPRAIRVRRALRKSGGATLLCGACGHPAVSLGSIDTCPECGSAYTAVGLDGTGTISKWTPPLLVCALVLLGAWLLGSATLAPSAARWANQKSIGAPMVSSYRVLSALSPFGSAAAPHALAPLVVEIDATLVRPLNPGTNLVPPPLPGSKISVRAAAGPAVAGAEPIWTAAWRRSSYAMTSGIRIHSSRATYGSPTPSRSAAPSGATSLVSPWDAMLAAAGPHELTLDPTDARWTLRDPAGATIGRGSGVEAAALALLDAIGVTPESWPDETWAEGARLALPARLADPTNRASIATAVASSPGDQPNNPSEIATRRAALLYDSMSPLAEPTRVATLHPSAPWGLTAAIGTSALLLVIALILLAIAWRLPLSYSGGAK